MGTVIDTSVVVAMERALLEPGSVNLETLPRDCVIPAIVLMELRVGRPPGGHRSQALRARTIRQ